MTLKKRTQAIKTPYKPHLSTIPVLMYRMISSYNYQGAAALGTILLCVSLIVFWIGEGGKKHAVS